MPVAPKPAVAQVAVSRNPYLANPYFANQPSYAPPDTAKMFSEFGNGLKISLPSLPSFPSAPQVSNSGSSTKSNVSQAQSAVSDASSGLNKIFASLKMMVPLTGDSNILPTIKKVYPTGEKPLVVINFKCPTEVIGITPPPMKLLHEALNLGFEGLNKTNLLSFNLQQVCS